MPLKTPCQEAFELDTLACRAKVSSLDILTWGFDYDRDENGAYTDFDTGSMFGTYLLGWEAAMENKAKNA